MQKPFITIIFLILIASCTKLYDTLPEYNIINTLPKTDTPHDTDTTIQKEINDKVPLCEQENPNFDATKTCQETMQQRHQNQTCTFTLGITNYTEIGSCTDCIITCTSIVRLH
ncbi:MAG: hypothetical protein AABX52_02545 [Nanoarchaeota archaeon]